MMSLPGIHPLFGDHIPVRLAGIDTPEMKGHCEREKQLARQARDLVRSALSGAGAIHLRKASRDKYFRIDARVMADGQDLSDVLMMQGLAVPYDGGTKTKDWCVEAGGGP
ncbi:MAG: thermonuclease family protein [Nitrospiraceae bacterium]